MGLKGMGLILVGGIVTCGIQTINETQLQMNINIEG